MNISEKIVDQKIVYSLEGHQIIHHTASDSFQFMYHGNHSDRTATHDKIIKEKNLKVTEQNTVLRVRE